MKEMRQRFDEVMKYKSSKNWGRCDDCPCRQECRNVLEEDYRCNDMFFAYITLGKNFDLKKEKILKNS